MIKKQVIWGICLGIVVLIFAIFCGNFLIYQEKNNQKIVKEVPKSSGEISQTEETFQKEPTISQDSSFETFETTEKTNSQDKNILPSIFKLNVPFVSQAPFAVWDDDHNDACEEAAILTVDAYLKKKAITLELADKEILAMIDYQKENWQGHFDLTVENIAKLAEEFYGYKNTEIKYDISIDDIKKEIVSGNPVILPTAGRMLFGLLEEGKNPYYRSPGPLYHVVVVIGFDDVRGIMIVNDPGTKRGKEFSFKYDVLKNAIHDWEPSTRQPNGPSAMIVLYP